MENINDFQGKCIEIVERHLKKEINTKLANDMSMDFKKELISYFCNNNRLEAGNIIGYFEDAGKLASGIFSAIKSKPSLSGIVFFKDGFCFRGGIFAEPMYLKYCEIRCVESKLTKLVIYKDKINSITLKGISYAEPTEIEKIFSELYKLNENKISITKKDKLKNFAIKAMDNILETASEDLENAIARTERNAGYVLENSDKFSEEKVKKAEYYFDNDLSSVGYEAQNVLNNLKDGIDDLKINRQSEE